MTSSPTSLRRLITIVAFSLAALLVAGLILFLVTRETPDEVTLDDAVAQIDDTDASRDAAPAEEDETAVEDGETELAVSGGIDGTWSVDTSVGDFGFEESTGTFVGFRVDEELSSVGAITAVGRTPEVSGTLVVADGTVTEVTVEADMNALVTDDGRRDSKTRGALETGDFPTASFVLTEPIELPADAGETSFSVDAVGELTVRGVTNPATFALEARLVDDVVVAIGSSQITFADYGVVPPSAPIVVSIADSGLVELQLFFSRNG